MKDKLLALKGVGLAASQIGYPLKLFIYQVRTEDFKTRKEVKEVVPLSCLINASYVPLEEQGKFEDWEGCFSVTSVMGKVPRFRAIQYQGYDENGVLIKAVATGFLARLLQHEIDHTEGRIITDVLTPDCLQGPIEAMILLKNKEFNIT